MSFGTSPFGGIEFQRARVRVVCDAFSSSRRTSMFRAKFRSARVSGVVSGRIAADPESWSTRMNSRAKRSSGGTAAGRTVVCRHPPASSTSITKELIVKRQFSLGIWLRVMHNALVQLQARYHHCGEAASEKCLSAATFVR